MPRRTGNVRALWLATPVALAALTFGFAPAAAHAAESEVRVELDQTTVSVDQPIGVRVILTSQGANVRDIELPEGPGLVLVGRSQSQQSSFSLGPGGLASSHSTVYQLSYQAKHPGDYTLGPARAMIDGRAVTSETVRVKVVPAGQAPRQPPQGRVISPFGGPFNFPGFGQGPPQEEEPDPFADLFGNGRPPGDSDLFLSATVDHKQVYLGQQVTYSLRLYTRVNVNEFDGLKLPGFDGFWGEDLETPTRPVPTMQTVGGVPYQTFLIKKRALFPSRAGTIALGPAEVDVAAGGVFFRGRKLHRSSAPLSVTVLPLPAGSPPGFSSSNVGQWKLAASLIPASVPVGEPATLVLTAEGSGNLHALTLPVLPVTPGLRTYDPTSTDRPAPQGDTFGGKRRVEIVIIPERTGTFEIPSLSFSTFDPATKSYQTQSTPALPLQVSAGSKGPGSSGGGGQNVLEAGYRAIRTSPRLLDWRMPELPERLRLPAATLPPVALGVALLVDAVRRRRERTAPGLKIRRAYRVAQKRLKVAAAGVAGVGTTTRADEAYGAVAGALLGYLEDRTSEALGGLPRPELAQRLRELGASAAAVGATLTALESCEHQRYAPAGHAGDADLLAHVEAALEALERCKLQSPPRAA